jgi:hypothetical protein
MKIVTSISPSRTERQQYCINSWRKYGYEIIALQPPSQVEDTKAKFPYITVLESNKVGTYKPNHIEIHEHIQLSKKLNDTVLLINSDIEMLYSMKEFRYWETPITNTFKIGIRWNKTTNECKLCTAGIDAFQITPDISNIVPNIGFVIGCPHWDYWLPYHLSINRYTIDVTKDMRLIHEVHDNRWTDSDYRTTEKLFEDNYPITAAQLSRIILHITDRN